MEVDGLPALCVNANCEYSYVAATAAVTAQTYDVNSMLLTVDGTSLPTSDFTLHFGGATCATGGTFSATQYSCTLTHAPRAGSHKAEIRVTDGLIPFTSGSDITINLVISGSSPSAANALGGDIMTIDGTGFPLEKELIEVRLESNDVNGDPVSSLCLIKTLTTTQVTCEVQRMTNEDRNERTLKVVVKNPRFLTRRREL